MLIPFLNGCTLFVWLISQNLGLMVHPRSKFCSGGPLLTEFSGWVQITDISSFLDISLLWDCMILHTIWGHLSLFCYLTLNSPVAEVNAMVVYTDLEGKHSSDTNAVRSANGWGLWRMKKGGDLAPLKFVIMRVFISFTRYRTWSVCRGWYWTSTADGACCSWWDGGALSNTWDRW